MHNPTLELLPRVIHRHTSLVDIAIIYPATEPRYRELADTIAEAIIAQGCSTPECVADTSLMPERNTPLPDAYRAQSLIVLGNLNTNRTLQPLYANYQCSTDATYPGGDGYDLRTLVNPYGTGANLILVGGSTLHGVERATDVLLAHIAQAEGAPVLPFLFEVELAPTLAANLAAWPFTPLEDSAELQALRSRGLMFFTEPIRIIGAYTLMWSWTSDERYALIARDALRSLNKSMTDGYGDWHYLAERFLRAIPLLIAGGFLDDADIRRTDELLLQTALGNESEWWRVKVGHPPLGHRHQGKGTYEFLLLARYLRDQTNISPALHEQCDLWIAECCTFLDALSSARIDDQDDECTLNNLATLYRYALGQERHSFFTSGNARLVAERCIALHDNNGNGAGQGGYGESQGMYLQQEATEQTACSAFYYGSGELKWILQTLPNLEIPHRYSFLCYVPVFLQKYATGPELTPVPPESTRNVTCLPVTDHQFTISNDPPVHVVPQGHMINAPETWELPEGIGINQLPQERAFDKLALRGGFARDDAYLLLQGYQGGFRWQGHMQAANCIVRFYQAGHSWLVQNTWRHSPHDKSGLFISDGANGTPMPPIAERVAVADFEKLALTVTRVSDYHHTDWTRHLFWSKAEEGFFVCFDRVEFKADGPYSLTCSWRTPGYAELDDRRWHSRQGDHRFTLVASTAQEATCEVETGQGACSPYVLRQRRAGEHRKGEEASYQNLFYVRSQDDHEALDIRRLDERSALIQRDGTTIAWCGMEIHPDFAWLPHSKTQAASIWLDSDSLALAGTTLLSLPGIGIQSTVPINASIDLTKSILTLESDAATQVSLSINSEEETLNLTGAKSLSLPDPLCNELVKQIISWLTADHHFAEPKSSGDSTLSPEKSTAWKSAWTYDSGSRTPELVRNVCVTADPLPIDGSPDQFLDPVMPDGYSRETWIQWPKSDHYSLKLTLPEPRQLTSLNIMGDCIDDPTLRTFNPLPEGLAVEAELSDGTRQGCAISDAPDRRYKRYRDAENRLQVRSAAIDETVSTLHLSIPAPEDDRPFVLQRLEICSDRTVLPAVERWITADIDDDGRDEIILTNANQELIVINDDGQERWRAKLPTPATHISVQPIAPDSPAVLCVGLLGGDLQLYHPDGSLRQVLAIAKEFQDRKDCLQGWYNATQSLSIWRRDDDGRGCLVVGGYAVLIFLNADGGIVGHSFSDGSWNYNILVSPDSRPDCGDIYVRCGWNHGIQYYQGVAGDGPSGEVYHLGGFNQPMFRMLKRVIPFLNGRSLAAEWVELSNLPEGALFFATELGCGVLSTAKKEWQWKLEGGMSLNTVTLSQIEGQPVALIGGVDGFVAAVDLSDGQVIRRRHVGAPVIGVSPLGNGELIVTTRTSVQILNGDWQPRDSISRNLNQVISVSDSRLLVSHDDHTLELLELTSL